MSLKSYIFIHIDCISKKSRIIWGEGASGQRGEVPNLKFSNVIMCSLVMTCHTPEWMVMDGYETVVV
jgi:hypothetical protein